MSTLDEERRAVKEKLQKLEGEKASIEVEMAASLYKTRESMTQHELQQVHRLDALNGEIATVIETYENLLLESTEVVLIGLAEDSRVIKRLTVWLVVLTLVLSLGTILDVLARLGLIR